MPTKTDVGHPRAPKSNRALYPRITPISSSRAMRSEIAGCDMPISRASARWESRASSTKHARIRRSVSSRAASGAGSGNAESRRATPADLPVGGVGVVERPRVQLNQGTAPDRRVGVPAQQKHPADVAVGRLGEQHSWRTLLLGRAGAWHNTSNK